MVIEVHSSGYSIKRYRTGAKDLVKREGIPLHLALDRMAQEFRSERTRHFSHQEVEPYTWVEMSKRVWKLDADNILRRFSDCILEYPDGRKRKHQKPIRIIYEIENLMLTDRAAFFSEPHRPRFGSNLTMRSRVYRMVSETGTLVERQVVRGDSGACFGQRGTNWGYSAGCRCCIRHEVGHDLAAAVLFDKAIGDRKLSDISAFTAKVFNFAERDPVSANEVNFIVSTPEAEAIVQRCADRYDRLETETTKYEKDGGVASW